MARRTTQIGRLHRRIVFQDIGAILARDLAVFQQIAAIGDPKRQLGVLLYQQDAQTRRAHRFQALEQILGQKRRQAERGFIQHQDRRVRHHGTPDGDHLLLTTRHSRNRLPRAVGQFGKQPDQPVVIPLGLITGAGGIGAQHQVFLDRQLTENAAPLWHQGDALFHDLMGG